MQSKKKNLAISNNRLTSEIVYRIIHNPGQMIKTDQCYPHLRYSPTNLKQQQQKISLQSRLHRFAYEKGRQHPSIKHRKSMTKMKTQESKNSQELQFNQKNRDCNLPQIEEYNEGQKNTKKRVQSNITFDKKSKIFRLMDEYKQIRSPKLKISQYLNKIDQFKKYKLKKYLKSNFVIDSTSIQNPKSKSKMYEQLINRQKQITAIKLLTQQNQLPDLNQKKKNWKLHILKMGEKQTSNAFSREHLKKEVKVNDEFSFKANKNCDDHPADLRMQKMMHSLSKALNSFGVVFSDNNKRDLPKYSKSIKKYKYFIGLGNNRNIIKALMKKRWWWEETKNSQKANFIWTQIKQEKINEQNLNPSQQYKTLQNKVNQIYKNQCQENYQSKLNRFSKPKIKNKKVKTNFFEDCISQYTSKPINYFQRPKVIHNHYLKNQYLGNKKFLFLALFMYCAKKEQKITNFIPETFYLQSNDYKELQDFQQNQKSLKDQCLWVIKPGENSNRGKGIQIAKSISRIKERFSELSKESSLIVQKYIDRPLLYNKRKFDIRIYMTAITIGKNTKYFWYSQGYIRTSSYNFCLEDYDDIYIHLTNDAIQSSSAKYGKFEPGNKLSYHDFDKYLQSLKDPKYISIYDLHNQMSEISSKVIQSIYPLIHNNEPQYCFQLFGLDFMIDSNFKPYLIQINTNPCLQLSSPCLQRLIPQMLDSMFRMSLDPIYPPLMNFPRTASNLIPENLYKNNKFQLLFDSQKNRDSSLEKHVVKMFRQLEIKNSDFQSVSTGN